VSLPACHALPPAREDYRAAAPGDCEYAVYHQALYRSTVPTGSPCRLASPRPNPGWAVQVASTARASEADWAGRISR
jgi:hypothetical protein